MAFSDEDDRAEPKPRSRGVIRSRWHRPSVEPTPRPTAHCSTSDQAPLVRCRASISSTTRSTTLDTNRVCGHPSE
jgi:hypothetical protein